mgnify:CR=1 FL=1
MSELSKLKNAVNAYRLAMEKCDKCSSMLLSNGLDPEPAKLMAKMEEAKVKMFYMAGKENDK